MTDEEMHEALNLGTEWAVIWTGTYPGRQSGTGKEDVGTLNTFRLGGATCQEQDVVALLDFLDSFLGDPPETEPTFQEHRLTRCLIGIDVLAEPGKNATLAPFAWRGTRWRRT